MSHQAQKTQQEIRDYLEAEDEKLAMAIQQVDTLPPLVSHQRGLYMALLRSVVGQQLSVKAAATIWERFINLSEQIDQPQTMAKLTDEALRGVGLSRSKVTYVRAIAEFCSNPENAVEKVDVNHDEGLIDWLTQIKGVGRWTAEMVLMFELGYPDIFAVDDLALRNTAIEIYQLQDLSKKEQTQKLLKLSELWSPYRSEASRYLWAIKDANPDL